MTDANDQCVREPHPHDILTSDNGTKVHANHNGNVYFLKLLVSDYNNMVKESNLSGISSAKRVIDKIRSQSPPGRFLREVEDSDADERSSPSSSEGRAKPKSKTRWVIMSADKAISTTFLYFEKVKDELERHKQKKSKNKKRQQEGESSDGNNKKAKTTTANQREEIDVGGSGSEDETKSRPRQAHNVDRTVIEIDSDESSNDGIDDDDDDDYAENLLTDRRHINKSQSHVGVDKDGNILPHPHDVLKYSGTSNSAAIRNHDGNIFVDRVIQRMVPEYKLKKSNPKVKKSYFTDLILKKVQNRVPSGRFLKLTDQGKGWYILDKRDIASEIKEILEEKLKEADAQDPLEKKLKEAIAQEPERNSPNVNERNLTGIKSPHPHDFLFGQDGPAHLGNKVFYEIMVGYKMKYDQEAYSKQTHGEEMLRLRYATKILKEFGSVLTPAGRFLQQNKDSKLWYDVGYDKALLQTEKVLTSDRPKILGGRRKPSKQKQEPSQQPKSGHITLPKPITNVDQESNSTLDIAASKLIGELNQAKTKRLLQKEELKLKQQQQLQLQQQILQQQQQQQQISQPGIGGQSNNPLLGNIGNQSMQHLGTQDQQQQNPFLVEQSNGAISRSITQRNNNSPETFMFDNIHQKALGSPQQMQQATLHQNITPNGQTNAAMPNPPNQNAQMSAASQMAPITPVPATGSINAAQINKNTYNEWIKLSTAVDKQIKELEIESFRSRQLCQQYATQQSNSQEQLRLLQTYRTQMKQFQQQFQQQQNAEQQLQILYQLQSQFQIQLQQLKIQQHRQIIQQQQVHRQEIQDMQKRQEVEENQQVIERKSFVQQQQLIAEQKRQQQQQQQQLAAEQRRQQQQQQSFVQQQQQQHQQNLVQQQIQQQQQSFAQQQQRQQQIIANPNTQSFVQPFQQQMQQPRQQNQQPIRQLPFQEMQQQNGQKTLKQQELLQQQRLYLEREQKLNEYKKQLSNVQLEKIKALKRQQRNSSQSVNERAQTSPRKRNPEPSNTVQPMIISSTSNIAYATATSNTAAAESKIKAEISAAVESAAILNIARDCSMENNDSNNKKNSDGYESESSDGSLVF